ncbi:ATP-binding protein [Anabaena lutea]|uniref:histidine kinase n=1 Tax=Anabaena lutea FACHB-196 TaxID=2692881 RepID=A0ABR8FKN8_9NOST|nr:ATP-binding protein [Anabaena lutea]MBD2570679.1 PAS domain-containing protein [Anabaena lutea FACHB-196]
MCNKIPRNTPNHTLCSYVSRVEVSEKKLVKNADSKTYTCNASDMLRQFAENITDAVFWMSDIQNHQLLYVSPTYERIWGRSCSLLYANFYDWLEAIHTEDREQVRTIFCEQAHIGGYDQEYRIIRPDGEMRWIRDRGFPIKDESGEPYRVVGIAEDITNRKQAEVEKQLLLQREQVEGADAEKANRLRDDFFAIISHELRTPLSPILGWTKLLMSGKLNGEQTTEALKSIERNTQAQVKLIEDLLDVSRILHGKIRLNICPVNLSSIISTAIEKVRQSTAINSIQLITDIDPDVGQVSGDLTRLQQLIDHLLSNAIKFTPEGGRVIVELSKVIETKKPLTERNSISATDYPAYAQIKISDTGKGISPEFLPQIFEYFRQEDSTITRKFNGLGLGLAIVRNLVELHNGTVEAESSGVGHGATFTVRLPLLAADGNFPDTCQSQPTNVSFNLSGMKILVVDDDTDSRDFVAFVLKQSGAEVTAVSDALSGLQAIPQLKPNVLISDIGMPHMNGYELVREIRTWTLEQGEKFPRSP